MVQLKDQIVEQADLLLTDKETNVLGADLILKESRVVLQVNAKRLTLLDVIKFIECDITAKRPLRDFRWHAALLHACRFHGTFIGNCFGQRLEESPSGGIEQCDFSEAILDGCAFYGCDMASIILPKWPCFTLLNLTDRIKEMTSLEWPGELGTWVRSYSCFPLGNMVAATDYAPTLMKQYKVSEEQLDQAISRLSNLHR